VAAPKAGRGLIEILFVEDQIALARAACTSPRWRYIPANLTARCRNCTLAVFWSLSINRLSGATGAAGIALINSVGNIGGYVESFATG
jgi:hypothetical protein